MITIECSVKSRSALVAMALMSSAVVAFAQEAPIRADMTGLANRTTRICAQRDLQLVTLIEERGDAQEVAGHKLFEAFLTVMRTRNACADGRESEALLIYDTVTLGLSPTHAAQ